MILVRNVTYIEIGDILLSKIMFGLPKLRYYI